MAEKKDIGYVYIFTNESFREGWVKIGKTRNINKRLSQLDNTSCPLPFDVYATLKTNRYNDAEDFVHDFISHFNQSLRIRPNREYFKVSPEEALDILYKVKKLMNEPDAEIIVYDDNGKKHAKQLEKKHSKVDSCKDESVGNDNIIISSEVGSQQTVWLLSSNLKYFDLRKCFKNIGQVYWKIKSNFKTVKEGDRGYIYSSAPDKAILYSFEVLKAPIPYNTKMDEEDIFSKSGKNSEWGNQGGYFAQLKLSEVKSKQLQLEHLIKYGLNGAPQNAIILSQDKFKSLLSYVDGAITMVPYNKFVPINNNNPKPRLWSLNTLPSYVANLNSNLTKEVMISLGIKSNISEVVDVEVLEKLKYEVKKVEKMHKIHCTHSCAISKYISYLKAGLTYEDMVFDANLINVKN